MNAERLFREFERISDTPDAIFRLRRVILDLAVRGKLVPQDRNDEPASELLKWIAKEKARLVKAGVIRRGQSLPSILDADLPFELPDSWVWTRLGEVIHLVSGQHLQPSEYSEDPVAGLPYITGPSDFGAHGLEISRFAVIRKAVAKKGQLLLTVKGSGVGKTAICNIPEVAISRQLMALTAVDWNDRFLLLITHRLAETLQAEARSLIPGISREDVDKFVFPLPPLAEQHRIVAKVDELMALCDRLEAERAQREAVRDRLTAASLARLSAPEPETFPDAARFVLDALPALTTRPDQIKRLRQSILSLAVRGLLVEQNPSDASPSSLLSAASGRKPARQRAGSNMDNAEGLVRPFMCPSTWQWTTVQGLLEFDREISYGVIKLGDEPRTGGIPTLRCSDVKPGLIDLSGVRKVSEDIEVEYARTRLQGGEIVINIRGTLGGVALVPASLGGFNVAREVAVIPITGHVSAKFYVYLMLSPYFWNSIQANLRGIAYKGLNLGTLRDFQVPLPPLAEQHRIVAKVDELMALCDRLEASLADGAKSRSRLLEALLAEALAPPESAAA